MLPNFGAQKDDGSAYVENMTHHAHIDIDNVTAILLADSVADGTAIEETVTLIADSVYHVEAVIGDAFGRTITLGSNDEGDVTVIGYDYLNQLMTETVTTIVGEVSTNKAFKRVVGLKSAANFTGDIDLKTGSDYGLPFCAVDITREVVNGAVATEGVLTAPDTSEPTATTGDVRGTYNPNTDTDGVVDINVTFVVTSNLTGGLYGPPQA